MRGALPGIHGCGDGLTPFDSPSSKARGTHAFNGQTLQATQQGHDRITVGEERKHGGVVMIHL